MAVVNQILHRKNTSGSYDTVYLQSNLSNVTGTLGVSNGGTGRSTLTSKAVLTGNGTSAVSLVSVGNGAFYSTGTSTAAKFGTLPVAQGGTGNTSVDTTPTSGSTKMCTSGGIYTEIQSLKTSVSNGKSLIASAITDKGISTAPDATFQTMANNIALLSPSFPKPSSHTPGDIITWDNKEWLVCHYDSSTNRVYLITNNIISMTFFGSNVTYAGSRLELAALKFGNELSASAISMIIATTVNDVTDRVFVPSYEQMNGGFSWFNNNARRIAYYNGNATDYWTSSELSGTFVWKVRDNGILEYDSSVKLSSGFRPCICVQL